MSDLVEKIESIESAIDFFAKKQEYNTSLAEQIKFQLPNLYRKCLHTSDICSRAKARLEKSLRNIVIA